MKTWRNVRHAGQDTTRRQIKGRHTKPNYYYYVSERKEVQKQQEDNDDETEEEKKGNEKFTEGKSTGVCSDKFENNEALLSERIFL